MITAQEIREKTLEKAVFGGYDMASVDSFLEEIASDLALLQKENAVLKGKMKVLVDKVEEYRDNEDALRLAVVSAQKLGVTIEREAREKANVMMYDAKAEASRITEGASAELKAEEVRLAEAKAESARFIENMNALCYRQLEFLKKLNEMDFVKESRTAQKASAPAAQQAAAPAPQPVPVPAAQPAQAAPEIHETVKSIEETVAKVMEEPQVRVRPNIAAAAAEDERPTKAFNIVTDPADDIDKTTMFSLDDFSK